jgi:phosphate transport system protein
MRQPVAIDLRIIVSSLKMASDLERIADNANNIARHVIHLNSVPLEKILESILALANHTLLMLDTVLESYRSMDIDKAKEVWHQDSETDRMYGALLGQLQKLMHDQSGSISDGTRLLGAAKCLERIGDHIQNIAESIHYIISADTYCGK